jgi:short-subunit dehydrogenase involved in D-alanine esterification of teichoic acids
MLARNPKRLAELERELPDCKGYACDVSDLRKPRRRRTA